jgi:putative FmdB family regulatory protein
MPTYEYACKSCGQHLEVVQSFKDSPLTQCPACGGAVRKVFGNIGIAFKGSGFYKTDSRNEAKRAKAGAPAKEAKEAAGSPAGPGGGSSDGSSSSSAAATASTSTTGSSNGSSSGAAHKVAAAS